MCIQLICHFSKVLGNILQNSTYCIQNFHIIDIVLFQESPIITLNFIFYDFKLHIIAYFPYDIN